MDNSLSDAYRTLTLSYTDIWNSAKTDLLSAISEGDKEALERFKQKTTILFILNDPKDVRFRSFLIECAEQVNVALSTATYDNETLNSLVSYLDKIASASDSQLTEQADQSMTGENKGRSRLVSIRLNNSH